MPLRATPERRAGSPPNLKYPTTIRGDKTIAVPGNRLPEIPEKLTAKPRRSDYRNRSTASRDAERTDSVARAFRSAPRSVANHGCLPSTFHFNLRQNLNLHAWSRAVGYDHLVCPRAGCERPTSVPKMSHHPLQRRERIGGRTAGGLIVLVVLAVPTWFCSDSAIAQRLDFDDAVVAEAAPPMDGPAESTPQAQPRLTGDLPTTRAAIRLLQDAVTVQADGRHYRLLRALRFQRDPELSALFDGLATADRHPSIRLHGILGRAEVRTTPGVSVAEIAEIADPLVQAELVGRRWMQTCSTYRRVCFCCGGRNSVRAKSCCWQCRS